MYQEILKKILFVTIAFIVLANSLVIFSGETYAKNNGNENGNGKLEGKYSDSTIIVKYKENVPERMQYFTNTINGLEEECSIGQEEDNIKVLKITDGQTVAEAIEKYSKNQNVEYVEPDYLCEFSLVPNDPYYTNQVNVFNMLNIPGAWDNTIGKDDIVVAVVDSGVNYNHVDLAGRIILGYDFGENKSDPMDNHGHGTNVAGVIVANTNNGIGVAGTTWKSKVLAIKVSNAAGTMLVSSVANAIRYAADNGADVINLSLGTASNSSTLKSAVDYAYDKGCIVVAASGNDGNTSNPNVNYPAAYSNVIGVGGTTNGTARYINSSYGTGLDVIAVYVHYTTSMGGGYSSVAGTSFASPQVAGLCALLLSLDSSLTNDQVRKYIVDGCTDLGTKGWDTETGNGLVNYLKSTQLVMGDAGNDLTKVTNAVSKIYTVEVSAGVNYIINMGESTSLQAFIQKLSLDASYKIDAINISGVKLTNDKSLGTGSTIIIANLKGETIQSYKAVIKGDTTGDGSVNLYDIVRIIKYVYDPDQGFAWDESIKKAGKVTGTSGTPGLFDIQRMINYTFNGTSW